MSCRVWCSDYAICVLPHLPFGRAHTAPHLLLLPPPVRRQGKVGGVEWQGHHLPYAGVAIMAAGHSASPVHRIRCRARMRGGVRNTAGPTPSSLAEIESHAVPDLFRVRYAGVVAVCWQAQLRSVILEVGAGGRPTCPMPMSRLQLRTVDHVDRLGQIAKHWSREQASSCSETGTSREPENALPLRSMGAGKARHRRHALRTHPSSIMTGCLRRHGTLPLR